MSKTEKNKNSKYGLIITVLGLLLVSFAIYSFFLSEKVKETEKAFETEKALKIEELKKVQQEYDDFLQENELNEQEIIQTKIRLNRLLDSVKNIKPDYTLVNKLRSVRDQLKLRLKALQKENERLKEENLKLVIEKDSVVTKLNNTLVVYKEIEAKNDTLNKIITKAQKLNVTAITNKSVRIKKSGKVTETKKAKRVSGIEVCYDIPANSIAEAGEKEFYIQVVSPDKQVIGGRFYMTNSEGDFVNISKVSKFRYENKLVKVCDYVEPLPGETFIPGKYAIHVFQGTKLISSSSILLK